MQRRIDTKITSYFLLLPSSKRNNYQWLIPHKLMMIMTICKTMRVEKLKLLSIKKIYIQHDDHLEEFLDEAYERFATRKEGSTLQRKRAKAAHANDDKELLQDGDMMSPDEFDYSDKDDVNDEATPLMVPLHIFELLFTLGRYI
ncbi:uncharacterized protein [Aristolochia californica]|uniref:uncharacterized protein n=1 Tax=Aristolochia californica TaxID=171875 RepID=UPI0035D550F0